MFKMVPVKTEEPEEEEEDPLELFKTFYKVWPLCSEPSSRYGLYVQNLLQGMASMFRTYLLQGMAFMFRTFYKVWPLCLEPSTRYGLYVQNLPLVQIRRVRG